MSKFYFLSFLSPTFFEVTVFQQYQQYEEIAVARAPVSEAV